MDEDRASSVAKLSKGDSGILAVALQLSSFHHVTPLTTMAAQEQSEDLLAYVSLKRVPASRTRARGASKLGSLDILTACEEEMCVTTCPIVSATVCPYDKHPGIFI